MTTPNQVPPPTDASTLVLTLPPLPPGTVAPPMGLQIGVGLTDPDAAGNQWAVLRLADGTVSAEFRIPTGMAGGIGQAIAEGLMGIQRQAETGAGKPSGLVVPPGARGLVIPRPVIKNGGKARG